MSITASSPLRAWRWRRTLGLALLVLFHALEPQLVADDLALVKDDENDKPNSERQHANSAEKEH